jgi:hypothetical protein
MIAPRGKITSYPREYGDGAVDEMGTVGDTGVVNSTNSAGNGPRERRKIGRDDLENLLSRAGDRLRRNP